MNPEIDTSCPVLHFLSGRTSPTDQIFQNYVHKIHLEIKFKCSFGIGLGQHMKEEDGSSLSGLLDLKQEWILNRDVWVDLISDKCLTLA